MIYEKDLSFEVIIGTTTQEILSSGKIGALSDLPEVGIKDNFSKNAEWQKKVPLDYLPRNRIVLPPSAQRL